MTRLLLLFLIALSFSLASPALAVEPDEVLDDPILEERARSISRGLRCVVCQNQDIDSSNAGVARDLRLLVRERLVAGDTDAEVMEYVRDRYSDYVLMSPPLNRATILLWAAPFLFATLAIISFVLVMTNRTSSVADELTAKERAELLSLFTRE